MKRGLLLAAFFATLVLDMGAGPVFIAYASLNLSKNASFPAATWLLGRGILNCVQFITVMLLCWLVARVKRRYSRKEEYLVIANLLATNPVSYFYYTVIIGGVIWNILGSGWVEIAFRDYDRGFGICYLVCIVLSWISTVLSPVFVFCGGLVYTPTRKAKRNTKVDGSIMAVLVDENDASMDLEKILMKINGGRPGLSVDDILWRQQFLPNIGMIAPSNEIVTDGKEPAELQNDQMPVTVTDIRHSYAEENDHGLRPMLDDLKQELHQPLLQTSSEVILIHRDILDDDDGPQPESAWSCFDDDIGNIPTMRIDNMSRGLSISSENERPSTSMLTTPSVAAIALSETPATSAHVSPEDGETLHSTSRKKSRKSSENKLYRRETLPQVMKGNVLLKKETIEEKPIEETQRLFEFNTLPVRMGSDDYVDIAERMKNQINSGEFEKDGKNLNVNVTYFS